MNLQVNAVKPTEAETLHCRLLFTEAEELYQKRVLTITGICVALLVVGIVCVVAYCKTKESCLLQVALNNSSVESMVITGEHGTQEHNCKV
ncbi:UNVERIFIED_CONTAM: hypothetical protein FKN15_042228 [Acipenser sinensis]